MFGEEVGLELTPNIGVPTDIQHNFSVEFIWNSTPIDRMQNAMKIFALNETAVSAYLYHKLLGHEVEDHISKVPLPKQWAHVTKVPNGGHMSLRPSPQTVSARN